MTIKKLTSTPGTAPEVIHLIRAFDACASAEDYTIDHVCNAAMNFAASTLLQLANAHGIKDRSAFAEFANANCIALLQSLMTNFQREPEPTDVEHHKH